MHQLVDNNRVQFACVGVDCDVQRTLVELGCVITRLELDVDVIRYDTEHGVQHQLGSRFVRVALVHAADILVHDAA